MFSQISHPGIILDNARNLMISIMATSLTLPIFGSEMLTILLGVIIGSYYGFLIEKQTHELSSLGGRILKGKNWDYLILP
jgi:hypothetical protein